MKSDTYWKDFWAERGNLQTAGQKTGRTNFTVESWVMSFGDAIKLLELKPNDYILDFGCGPGFFSHIISSLGYTVIGYDIAENLIVDANTNFGGNENLTFTCDFNQIENYSYSKILCYSSLQYVPEDELEPLINKLLSVLASNGKLVIASVPHDREKYIEHLDGKETSEAKGELELLNKINWFDKKMILNLINSPDFEVVELDMPEGIWNSFYMKNYVVEKNN